MATRFPGFKNCMAMMRDRDPQVQEDGFHWLLPRATEHVAELIDEFRTEANLGMRCWLLELIGSARSATAFELLAEQLLAADPSLRYWAIDGLKSLDTKEARTQLWEAQSYTFASSEETEQFRAQLKDY